MRGVEDLDVFGRAHELTLQLYKATDNFPKEELYALTSQIKRAASSICANLLEGSHNRNENFSYDQRSRRVQ